MPVSQELIKGTVIPVVLSLLKERARYGYEMVQLVNARTNGALSWSEGTLYPVLHKLEADRLVHAEWRQAEGGRRRRYYSLTAAGRRELSKRSAEWKSLATPVRGLLLPPIAVAMLLFAAHNAAVTGLLAYVTLGQQPFWLVSALPYPAETADHYRDQRVAAAPADVRALFASDRTTLREQAQRRPD